MNPVHVNLGPRSYDITFATSQLNVGEVARAASPRSTSAMLVADEHTEALADPILESFKQAGFRASMVIVQAGEETKSLFWAGELYDELAEIGADRRTLVVPIGGGVVGDLAGFTAATYNRGLPLFMIPTTLLAMVDSSVGGKVGINHAKGKNLIGAFHQPVGVWIDTNLLSTLPDREYLSGLAEVVKYGVIMDAEFFAFLEANAEPLLARDASAIQQIVARSCQLKAQVVEQDEREETGLRAILNYGHTFAHAFETIAGYGTWLHGEAVSAGMICASQLAHKLAIAGDEVIARPQALLKKFQLPLSPLHEWDAGDMIAIMRRDKKAQSGKLNFVLPTKIGHVQLMEVMDEALVQAVLTSNK